MSFCRLIIPSFVFANVFYASYLIMSRVLSDADNPRSISSTIFLV